ncbi:MAG: M48 family metallopeptidase [Candidatus Bathyarchaeia archaeon]|jgi:heat shock protein HtpX
MFDNSVSFVLETEVPNNYIGNMLDFIYQKYLVAQKQRFTNISRSTENGESTLNYDVIDKHAKRSLAVTVNGSNPLRIKITPVSEGVTEQAIEEARQDVAIGVDYFEEQIRQNTLYFAWREGEEIVPEVVSSKEKKPINRLFLETQILLFVVFTTVGLFLFLFLYSLSYGWIAPIAVLAIQLVFVFYSNRFIERTADWRITRDNPSIHLLEYRVPLGQQESFRKNYPPDKLKNIKKEVYEQTILKKGEIDCGTTGQIFNKYGLECSPENLSAKKVNIYELVEKTRQKFGFPMPRVVVSNTMLPNAAASGPSPSRGTVLITTGLLAQLNEDEIISVLGHEFGHLKGRDPLLLFGLMSAEFLFRFYVLLPLFTFLFTTLLFLVYFWAVMTLIFFIAKFFEARADLTSAIVIRQPRVLADALEKIGFKRLLFERVPSYRIQEWTSLDPHPPIYFRVDRLRKLQDTTNIKHPLFQSAKEVTRGFINSL